MQSLSLRWTMKPASRLQRWDQMIAEFSGRILAISHRQKRKPEAFVMTEEEEASGKPFKFMTQVVRMTTRAHAA
jgi:hypothetical protein